ncbi:MAG: hypothetical protein ACOYOK_11985, partial [Pseudobdellovibrionaceae bacterium]
MAFRVNGNSQSGQAVTEYILILVVVVALILTAIRMFFSPAEQFMNQLLGKGGYYACLLETGELPTLSSDEESAECKIPNFKDIAAAADASGTSGGKNGKSGADSESEGKKNSNLDSSQGGSSSSSRGSNNSTFGRNNRSNRLGSAGAESSGNKKSIEISLEGDGSSAFFKSNTSPSSGRPNKNKSTYIPITGLTESQRKKIEKKQSGGQRTIALDEGSAPPVKKIAVKPPGSLNKD